MNTQGLNLDRELSPKKDAMGDSIIKSYASSAEQGPFTLQLKDQSPGAGSEAYGRCQPLPLLIFLL